MESRAAAAAAAAAAEATASLVLEPPADPLLLGAQLATLLEAPRADARAAASPPPGPRPVIDKSGDWATLGGEKGVSVSAAASAATAASAAASAATAASALAARDSSSSAPLPPRASDADADGAGEPHPPAAEAPRRALIRPRAPPPPRAPA
jgi:hypothetical protein